MAVSRALVYIIWAAELGETAQVFNPLLLTCTDDLAEFFVDLESRLPPEVVDVGKAFHWITPTMTFLNMALDQGMTRIMWQMKKDTRSINDTLAVPREATRSGDGYEFIRPDNQETLASREHAVDIEKDVDFGRWLADGYIRLNGWPQQE